MKKILLILLAILIFSCEQIDNTIDYFAELSANTTTGTIDTEFIFIVNTNDTVTGIYANGIDITTRAINNKFDVGEYVISVKTENGATDELTIVVNKKVYTTRFIINKNPAFRERTGGTIVELNYPILTRDGVEFDIENMATNINGFPVITSIVGTERIVKIDMDIEWGTDSFLFHSGNMTVIFDFTRYELFIDNMLELLEYLNYVEPIPEFKEVRFNISGDKLSGLSWLVFYDDKYTLNGVEITYKDAEGSLKDNAKTINLKLHTDIKDSFLLRSNNMMLFFDIGITNLTKEEALKASLILNMYAGSSNMRDCVLKFNPDSQYAKDIGLI